MRNGCRRIKLLKLVAEPGELFRRLGLPAGGNLRQIGRLDQSGQS